MSENKKLKVTEIKYPELIKFFLPLAVMPVIIGITHNAVNASLPNNVSKKVNLKRITKFFIPIAVMAFLARFVQPVVQS
ncbi:MAG: hypothetical protein CI947_285 [Halanaerobium sp.]|nr:MAG: hypothetical protein CI947_285 [Halanaerobium sp.]